MPSIEDKRIEFRRLHQSGCFAIPNPWDIGTAKYLQHLGFKAIATTSAGFAFSRGLSDGAVKRDDMLAHIRELVEATDIPGTPITKTAMPTIRRMSPKACGCALRLVSPVFQLKMRPIGRRAASTMSILQSSESRRRAKRSERAAFCW